MPLTLAPNQAPVPLPQRLRHLRSRLRTIIVLRQGGQAVALVALVIALFCLLDWRFQLPALVRAVMLPGFLAGCGALVSRTIIMPWRRHATLLTMAQRVEHSFPDLNDSLTSAIQFLELPEDQLTGSQILREETIQAAVHYSEDLDFSEAVPSRWTKRSLLGLLIVGIGALWIVDRAPGTTALALERLFVPFGAQTWPAKTRIEVLAPDPLPHRMARGDAIDLQFRLHGIIPDRVRLSLWLDGASPADHVYVIERTDLAATEALVTLHIDANRISRSFRFRLRANDADTGWQSVEVLPPPTWAPRDGRPSPQIHLTFPRYTEFAPVDLPDGNDTIEAVTGTRVQIRAATARPVARVSFRLKPEQRRLATASIFAPLGSLPAPASAALLLSREIWSDVPVFLSADGVHIDVDFVPRLSGTYLLRIEDETGLQATRNIDVRIQPDPAPVVILDRPSSARDALAVLPDAGFTVVALINDVVRDKPNVPAAIRLVGIEYRTGAKEPFRRFVAYDGNVVGPILPHLPVLMRLPLTLPMKPSPRLAAYALVRPLTVRQFTHSDGSPLREGDTLTLRVIAEDYDDTTWNKPIGVSGEVDLQIVSKSQLDAALQLQLAQMRNEIVALNGMQHEARTRLQEALQRLRQFGSLRREDLERLLKTEQTQQQIRSRIDAKDEGLLAQATRLKQTILDNRLPRSTTTQRIDAMFADLKRLAEEELGPIEPLIATARADLDKSPMAAGKQALTRAEGHQKEVEETLRSLLERLEPWSGAGEMRGEARSILSDLRRQLEMLQQMQQSQKPGILGAKRNDLPTETRNELDRAAVRPERLAERLRQLFEKIDRLVDDKEKALKEKLEQLQTQERDAEAKAREADKQPKGSRAERDLRKQSEALRNDAEDTRASIAALEAELAALKAALAASDPQSLRQQAHQVPQQIRDNKLGDAQSAQQRIADRLEKMVGALEERPTSDKNENDLLQKKRTQLDAKLEQLIGDQELLQKKIDDAKKIADPDKRAEALKELAPEQERLERTAQELAQQLTRAGADESAQQLRRAARQMEQARQQLEQGMAPDFNQEEALNRLDEAQAKLQDGRDGADEELIREQLIKAADQIRALRERQFAALEEEKRLTAKAIAGSGWDLASAKQSLPGLINQQKTLAEEVRLLIDKRFSTVPVFSRMLRQSAEAMDQAVVQLLARESDVIDQLEGISNFSSELEEAAHGRIRSRQELALKRLDQLLEALKPDKEMFKPQPKKKDGAPMMQEPKGKPEDSLPPLAQLKALRALQADVGERTAAFDKAHPDRSKLTPDELAELEFLKRAQIDVAELVESLTPARMMGE
jgi:DNA repair exonuclease SbcCD ATPase subunit